jgi:wobble nucleotide-excising tRNase
MIKSIDLLRNIGRFDDVSTGASLKFNKLTVIYAENARGKSTLAAILRSLSSGRSELINERARLGTTNRPHVVIDTGVVPKAVFQNGNWNRVIPELIVFDDTFIADNVYSGIEVGTTHRQNLHELIVGAQGITLARALQTEVDLIETHIRTLRDRENAIPADKRGKLTVDQFCNLAPIDNLARLIQEAEKRLAAAREAGRIAAAGKFDQMGLPSIDLASLRDLLTHGLPEIDVEALRLAQEHIRRLGRDGETWVGQGLRYVDHLSADERNECPFCAQDLHCSPLLTHYRAYFSEAYNALRRRIIAAASDFRAAQAGDVPATFERSVREAIEKQTFWKAFADVPEINIDTTVIARSWKTAREHIERMLDAKLANPIAPVQVSQEAERAIVEQNKHCARIAEIADQLASANALIDLVKEQAKEANVAVLASDLANLKAVEARYDPAIAPLCDAYLNEKSAKAATEARRNAARQALDQHRQAAFPAYGIAINEFLQRFNASFRVGPISHVNNRSGSAANYTLLIDNHPVSLSAETGMTSFRNTLSAGDRNTLALAFFFASLQNDPQRSQRIIVIDDPMTSLDEHRTLHTLQEMDRLAREVTGMVVLSHSKPFLLGVWDKCQQLQKTALEVRRAASGSTLVHWNVKADMATEHDRRHAAALDYLSNADPTMERRVAESLRPMIEAFCRVAYPSEFSAGSMLGPFHAKCLRALGTNAQIMDESNTRELRALLDYSNRYHHDTNSTYAIEVINDAELTDFTRRTLSFIKRP